MIDNQKISFSGVQPSGNLTIGNYLGAIKNFSSGMVARLGFAIATMNIPDILIIDEILAVGDYKFQQKSFNRMQEMINSGATVVFVSHSVEQVKDICKKALWLEHGNVVKFGPVEEVCNEYMNS